MAGGIVHVQPVLLSAPPDLPPPCLHWAPSSFQDGLEDESVDSSMHEVLDMNNTSFIKERDHEEFLTVSASHGDLSSVLPFGQPHFVAFFGERFIDMKPRFIGHHHPFKSMSSGVRIQEIDSKCNPLPLLRIGKDMRHIFGHSFSQGQLLVQDPVHSTIGSAQQVAQAMDLNVLVSLDCSAAHLNVSSVAHRLGLATPEKVTNLESSCSILLLEVVHSCPAVGLVLKDGFELVEGDTRGVSLSHTKPDAHALDNPQRDFHWHGRPFPHVSGCSAALSSVHCVATECRRSSSMCLHSHQARWVNSQVPAQRGRRLHRKDMMNPTNFGYCLVEWLVHAIGTKFSQGVQWFLQSFVQQTWRWHSHALQTSDRRVDPSAYVSCDHGIDCFVANL